MELYHGGKNWRWERPCVQPPRKGRYECGPGIYFTNSYERARQYAKGSNVVMLAELAEPVRWLEDAKLPVADMAQFIRGCFRMKNKEAILADLQRSAKRMASDRIPVEWLVNLGVNHEALAGECGLALARWLVANGIDASRHEVSANGEFWVIVFNPEIIQRPVVVKPSEVSLDRYWL